MNKNKVLALAKELYTNEEVAIELANVIFGIRDGDYNEPEFTYPMYFKCINGIIAKFTAIDTFEYMQDSYGSSKVGEVVANATPHTKINVWTQIAFDEERGIWDKAVVSCWDNNDTCSEVIKFYDAINKTTFQYDGCRKGHKYDSYEIVENPSERMLKLQKTLKD